MAHLLSLLFVLPLASADDCGQWGNDWNTCKTVADCAIFKDTCGIKRAVNKVHLVQAQKFLSCRDKGETCAKDSAEESNPIVKCEAYSVRFAGAKAKEIKPACLRISDIVGMAINNNDLSRIEAAIGESNEVDMSLNHIHETPLTLAALNAKTDLVRWLISKGAKVNFQTRNGYTALMFAALSRTSDKAAIKDTIALLLSSGADKSLRNAQGETALDQAKLAKNPEAIRLLQ